MTDKMAIRYLSPVKSLMKKLDFDKHYIEALDHAIKNLKERPKSEWIPVSEKLPEIGEAVLCQCQANIFEVLKLTNDGWLHDNKHCYMMFFVIAWQPLPKAYKKDAENDNS